MASNSSQNFASPEGVQTTTDETSEHMERLKEENDQLRKKFTCRKCKKERVETLFLPCRHLGVCEHCAELMDDCCICNAKILGTVRTIMVPKIP